MHWPQMPARQSYAMSTPRSSEASSTVSPAETRFDFPARANVTEASAVGASRGCYHLRLGRRHDRCPRTRPGPMSMPTAADRPAGANDSILIRSSGTSSSWSIWMIESIISFGPQICTSRSESRGTTRFNNSGEILPRSPGQLVPCVAGEGHGDVQVGKPPPQVVELVAEDDVVLGLHGEHKVDLPGPTEVGQVADLGHQRRDADSAADHHDALGLGPREREPARRRGDVEQAPLAETASCRCRDATPRSSRLTVNSQYPTRVGDEAMV